MSSRHAWLEPRPAEQRIFRASELGDEQLYRLITVADQDPWRCRGWLMEIRPADQGELTASPGDLVLEMRPARAGHEGPPRWRAVVAPDARVIVHSPTHSQK